jgi:hypothetical protein
VANVLTAVVPRILAMALESLRAASMMPMLVNRGYERNAGEKGTTIDVPIPSAITVQDVVPNNTPPNTADIQPTTVPITLDQWKEAPFYLSDKDQLEAMEGIIPMQAQEAVNALADTINNSILGLYKDIYGFAGTPGTTPFASGTADATEVRKVLQIQKAPLRPRYGVLDPEAEANALNQRAFQDQSWRSNNSAIIEGQIARTLGFDWFGHQNIPVHLAGTLTGTITVGADAAVGAKSIRLNTDAAEAIALKKGDIITFAGQGQTYVVTADLTVAASGNGNVLVEPGLKVAITAASNTAVSVKGSHTVNLFFHRDAFAFASRPLQGIVDPRLGSIITAAVDAESGLTLRLEVTREHKRIRWSFDILYGVATVRRELAARLAG